MPFLRTDLNANVLTLTVDRPKANAYNLELIGELQSAFRQAAEDKQVRVVVLTGSGHIFGAGQDITEMRTEGESISYREHLLKTYNPLILQIRQIEKPVIAAVNGMCAGASLGIALACDLRIAADTARFVVGFGGIALIPDSAVTVLLPALIGLGRAMEYYLSNAQITAQQAIDWGMVNQVIPFDDLHKTIHEVARAMTKAPIGAFGLTKRAFNKAMLPNLEDVLDYEGHIQEIAGKSAEHKEGVAAFIEKRPPKFL
ncbi:MAG: enoyl-CoA hydratase/isomerase family protein [Anaerolineales bacterium]|nr:enoyl-CoA hydratase/isomerase family protein [Anaerolineales bacterium]